MYLQRMAEVRRDEEAGAVGGITAAVRRVLEALTAALLFLLMGTTVVDVVGRYVVGRPLPGSAEISAIILGLFVFASLPLVNLRREHIIVDLFSFSTASMLGRLTGYLSTALSLGCSLWIAYEVLQLAMDLARHGDTTSFLHIPYAPVAVFMAVASLIAGLFSLAPPLAIDEQAGTGLDDGSDE